MTGDPKRPDAELVEKIAHEVHEFASFLRAMETGEEDVDLWYSVYGRVALPRGMTQAAAATGRMISTKYAAAMMVARELAHRVAIVDGTSIVEVVDAAERQIADAARRAVEEG